MRSCSIVLIVADMRQDSDEGYLFYNFICASGSVVEHCLAKAGVAGSNPVSRS